MWKDFAEKERCGLVLAGGGARGAYQVGAVKALQEAGYDPGIIAGTSIGALNGSMIAQFGNLGEASPVLEDAWQRLGAESVIQADVLKFAEMLTTVAGAATSHAVARAVAAIAGTPLAGEERALLSVEPIRRLLEVLVDCDRLRNGNPLWVAVTKLLSDSHFPGRHLLETARAAAMKDVIYVRPADAESDDDLYGALVASAAIPFAFPSQRSNGRKFLDGGIVDNVPLAALRAQGCDLAVVIHLSNGSIWDRNAETYDGVNVLEIRPSAPVQEKPGIGGWIKSLIDFRPERIEYLRQMGYADANETLGRLSTAKRVINDAQAERENLLASTMSLLEDDFS